MSPNSQKQQARSQQQHRREDNMDDKIANVRKLLEQHDLDAVFISSLPNIAYVTNYSGFTTHDRDAFVLITKKKQYIFTHGIYKEDVKQKVRNFTLIEIKRENPISTAIKHAVDEHTITKLGFEAFDLKVSEYTRMIEQIAEKILRPTTLVNKLRINKSKQEIALLKKACELGDKTFSYISKQLKNGITETELAAQLDYFVKTLGADVSFETIVAFEENAAYPHHVPTTKKLTMDSFVLLDFGVKFQNYCSDMTRTISFGKVDPEKKKIYDTVLNSQKQAVLYIEEQLNSKQKINGKDADKAARDYIIAQGYNTIPHSLGHGIGLEVHEAPRLSPAYDEELKEGMVFSIEPGIYIPGNTGVRIEDLYTIQNNKLLQITNAPNELLIM